MPETSTAPRERQGTQRRRSSWVDKKHGIKRIAADKEPPCIYKPFDAAQFEIPSQFSPAISKFLREKLRIQYTGHDSAIYEPGYILQHTTRYYEVDEAKWVLVRPRMLADGKKYRFLFHAHHFMITFSGNLPHPGELDELTGKLQEGVLASLSMEEEVAIDFYCFESHTRRIYPPLKSGHKLRYLFASEFPGDPTPLDNDEDLEGKLNEYAFRDATRVHYLTSPALRNRNFEWVDDMGSSRKGKERAPASNQNSEDTDRQIREIVYNSLFRYTPVRRDQMTRIVTFRRAPVGFDEALIMHLLFPAFWMRDSPSISLISIRPAGEERAAWELCHKQLMKLYHVDIRYAGVHFSNDNVSQLFAPECICLNGVDIRIGTTPDYQMLLREKTRFWDNMARHMPYNTWAHRAREFIRGMVHSGVFTRRGVQDYLHRYMV
ncbi:hypothetical protein F5Y08DRAFT_351919 [Xylaria arbuscula]|nr:hypothetical protein F5Y08DRAFT_351919 [Xylaria arbuscula]